MSGRSPQLACLSVMILVLLGDLALRRNRRREGGDEQTVLMGTKLDTKKTLAGAIASGKGAYVNREQDGCERERCHVGVCFPSKHRNSGSGAIRLSRILLLSHQTLITLCAVASTMLQLSLAPNKLHNLLTKAQKNTSFSCTYGNLYLSSITS